MKCTLKVIQFTLMAPGLLQQTYLFIERTNLTAGQKSISVSSSKLWNEIPFDIRNSQSLNVFKKKYKEFPEFLMDQGQ